MLKLFRSTSRVVIKPDGFSATTFPAKFSVPKSVAIEHQHACRLSIEDDSLRQEWKSIASSTSNKPRFLDLVLPDDWVKYFMFTPSKKAQKLQDYQAAAVMRFESLYGVLADEWVLEADWHLTEPSLVCAIPKTLISKLIGIAKENQQSILSMQPYFVSEWNTWRNKPHAKSWLAVVCDQVLTLGITHDSQLTQIRTICLPTVADVDWLQTYVTREALMLNIALPQRVQVVGDVPASWQIESDGILLKNCLSIEKPSGIGKDSQEKQAVPLRHQESK